MHHPTKRYATLVAILLSFAPLTTARGLALFYSWPPYSCTSNMAGFNLTVQRDAYRLTGPLYVPRPGYAAAFSDVRFIPGVPHDAEATLTLIPPSNILTQYALRPLTVVPPLWIDVSFVAAAPIHKLTIFIANPVNRFDTQITCLLTGAIQ